MKRNLVSEPAPPNAPVSKRRPNSGSFRKGAPGPRLSHGLYTDAHPQGAAITALVEQFLTAQFTDEGVARAEVSARRGAQIEYRGGILHKNILKLALALEERGLFDKRGKLRVTWLSMLNSYISTAIRIDALLGLERRARKVQNPIEWLESLSGAEEAPTNADIDAAVSQEPDDAHAGDHD